MLAGSSFSTILRLLKENRFDVEPRHLPRLADALLKVGLSTPLRFLDKNRFEDRILSTEIPKPPVFVIGHWRSGTTFLHNLMAEDGNLEYPTTFHTLMPWSFMGGDLFLRPHLEDALPPTRPMDDIPMHLDFPY